jgi:hypothetical protein
MARPQAKIDGEQLRAFMRLSPTLADTAAFFAVSEDTITRFIKRKWKASFAEFRDQNMVHTRYSIIRKAIQKAQAGDNTMIIWVSKNMLGWADSIRQEHTGKNGGPIEKQITFEEGRAIFLADYATQPAPEAKVEDL